MAIVTYYDTNGVPQPVDVSDGSVHVLETDAYGNEVSSDYPTAVNVFSVTPHDIDEGNSDVGTFTGDLEYFFKSLDVEKTSTGATNPKWFTISLLRPIVSDNITIGSKTGDFSNVKIEIISTGGDAIYTIDDSSNATKYSYKSYPFPPVAFAKFKISFATADDVSVGFVYVLKTLSVSAKATGEISFLNSRAASTLAGGATWTGTFEEIYNFSILSFNIYSTALNKGGTLYAELSMDGSTIHKTVTYTVTNSNNAPPHILTPTFRYFRLKFVAGGATPADDHTAFTVQTIYHSFKSKGLISRINDTITASNDVENTRSVIVGETTGGGGGYVNVKVNPSGALSVNAAQTDPTALLAQVNIQGYRSSDATWQPLRLDKATNSIQTIDYEHHEIHAGTHFFYTDSVELDSAGTQDYMITTPDSTTYSHMIVIATGSLITQVQIYEAGNRTGTTPQTVFNSDRNSATASTLVIHKGTSGGATDGTLIWQRKSGTSTGPSRTGMETTRGGEKILKRNTKYIIRITSSTNDNLTNLQLDWYEHANIV